MIKIDICGLTLAFEDRDIAAQLSSVLTRLAASGGCRVERVYNPAPHKYDTKLYRSPIEIDIRQITEPVYASEEEAKAAFADEPPQEQEASEVPGGVPL